MFLLLLFATYVFDCQSFTQLQIRNSEVSIGKKSWNLKVLFGETYKNSRITGGVPMCQSEHIVSKKWAWTHPISRHDLSKTVYGTICFVDPKSTCFSRALLKSWCWGVGFIQKCKSNDVTVLSIHEVVPTCVCVFGRSQKHHFKIIKQNLRWAFQNILNGIRHGCQNNSFLEYHAYFQS